MAASVKITPASKRELRKLGISLKQARIRRRLSMEHIAERAGMTRVTLGRIENGDPNVRIGGYALVMQALGLLQGFGEIDDVEGEQLAYAQLPKLIRPKKDE